VRKTLKYFIKEGYDKASSVYEEYRLPWIEGPLIYLESSILKDVLKDGLTLEVGIGTGRIARYFASKCRYFGIDISPLMLRKCKMKYGHSLELILSDAENICFKENSFDNLLAMKVFKLLEPFKFLKEAKRVLKNGGRVFIFLK
jgi:ubiquinone/menaquinone biosynthesis C-methylase UbiE